MSDVPKNTMTSNRPYLIRAIYEWVCDNGMTPYLLVDAKAQGVRVPPASVHEGKVVLNVAPRAVSQLELGNDQVHFLARFGGVSQSVVVPIAAVQAIYAQETGQGMMLPPEDVGVSASLDEETDTDALGQTSDHDTNDGSTEPPRRGGHLRVVK